MKSLCRLFLSLSIFLVLVCVGCDTGMQQNEKTDLVFSFRTPNFRSTQSIEDNPTLLIEACLVDYDGKTIQKTEKEISSGEAVSFQFLKIATNINIKVKIQVFVKGDESPSYTGESDWILTQAGTNKVSVMLEKVKQSLFEINFNSMGGSEVFSQVLESGVVEKPENPTKEGYIFDDWYTSSNNGETLESVFDFDTPIEKDLTLYAKWTPISYTVKFDANNENATGSMDAQIFTYDKAANLNKNAFEVKNYGFVEWNTKSDGSGTAYLDEAEILNLTTENGAEITLYAQWIETSTVADYKVKHFQQNIEGDGYTLVETEDKVGTIGKTTTASAKSYEGFTAKEFTQADIAGDGTTIVKIYYDRKNVTLTFDLAGGMSGNSTKIEKTGKYGAPVEIPENPTRNGYTFEGWDKTVPESFPANDETYTAKWIDINQVKSVTFNPVSGTVANNTKITLDCATEGATIYYRTSEKDEFVIYDSNTSLAITEETTITAYAICEGMIDSENTSATYKLYQYTLAFETNAGSEITDSNSYSDGATVKLAFQTTREGYTFAGWYMSADYSGDSVTELTFSQEMEGLDKDSNTVTLSAKWTPISYTVKFDANNENATGTTDAQIFTYDKAANLNKNAFEVENYGFVEWNTNADGSGTAYLDEAEILNLTTENGAEIVLYAQWIETSTAADYKVKHYKQNIEDDEYTLFETENKVGTIGKTTTASAKSYEGFTAKEVTQGVIAGDGTTIVEIYYDRKDITLTFDLAGGMSGDSTEIEKTGKYGAPVEKPEDPTRNGYTFEGWDKEIPTTFPATAETYTAKWIVEGNFKITYELYGGTNNDENPEEYNVESETITLKEPTKAGYTFLYWTNSSTNKQITEIAKGSIGDITLLANWEVNTDTAYKVEHHRQNIEDDEYTLFEIEDKVGTTGETTTASAKSYEGFTAKDFTQADIAGDGTTIVKIYYDRKDVTITFDLAGGMSEGSTKIEKTGKYGALVEKPEDPTKEGYIFDDWYTSSNNGETLESVFNFDTPIEKDLTLYAQWQKIDTSIEVTFPSYDDPEGLISYDEESQTFTAKEGYSSYEWFIDGELQGGNQSFILNTDNMTGGIYTVMLIVTTESGDMYSAEYQVTIIK